MSSFPFPSLSQFSESNKAHSFSVAFVANWFAWFVSLSSPCPLLAGEGKTLLAKGLVSYAAAGHRWDLDQRLVARMATWFHYYVIQCRRPGSHSQPRKEGKAVHLGGCTYYGTGKAWSTKFPKACKPNMTGGHLSEQNGVRCWRGRGQRGVEWVAALGEEVRTEQVSCFAWWLELAFIAACSRTRKMLLCFLAGHVPNLCLWNY